MGHLTDNELAGFLDGDLPAEERARVEAHLEACGECRAEMVEVAALVHDAPAAGTAAPGGGRGERPRWRLPAGLVGLAAAAGIALLLFWPGGPGLDRRPVTERFVTEGVAVLEARSPAPDAIVPLDGLRFAWAGHDAASYRITLTAEDGALVWTETVTDTVVAPPVDLDLLPGRTFFWYVDAIDVGIVARTGAHSFTIAP
jgi:hypothetical protein